MILHTYFIKGWEISKRRKLFSGSNEPSYCRDITIKTELGEEIKLTLHADDRNRLAPVDSEFEKALEQQAKELV